MNSTTRFLTRNVAAAAATLLLAAPLAASAQTTTPTQDQMNAIKSQTIAYFDAVHYADFNELSNLTAPNFKVTYPNGMTIGLDRLIERSSTRNVNESGFIHQTKFRTMTADGSTITENVEASDVSDLIMGDESPMNQTESSTRTLTWAQGEDGKWRLASEKIDSIVQGPYGELLNQ